jgi:hypothetical protein
MDSDITKPTVIRGFVRNEEPEIAVEPITSPNQMELTDESFRYYFLPFIQKVDELADAYESRGASGGEWFMLYNFFVEIHERRKKDLVKKLGLTDEQLSILGISNARNG